MHGPCFHLLHWSVKHSKKNLKSYIHFIQGLSKKKKRAGFNKTKSVFLTLYNPWLIRKIQLFLSLYIPPERISSWVQAMPFTLSTKPHVRLCSLQKGCERRLAAWRNQKDRCRRTVQGWDGKGKWLTSSTVASRKGVPFVYSDIFYSGNPYPFFPLLQRLLKHQHLVLHFSRWANSNRPKLPFPLEFQVLDKDHRPVLYTFYWCAFFKKESFFLISEWSNRTHVKSL